MMDSQIYTMKVLCADSRSPLHYPATVGIKKIEHTDFSHYAIMGENNVVYEAKYPRARRILYGEWIKDYKIIRTYELSLTLQQFLAFNDILNQQVGTKYSMWQCAMIWVAQTFRGIQGWIENTNWNGIKSLICSEFIARPINKVLGYKFNQGMDSVGMDEVESALKQISTKRY